MTTTNWRIVVFVKWGHPMHSELFYSNFRAIVHFLWEQLSLKMNLTNFLVKWLQSNSRSKNATLIPYERRGNFARNSPTVMAFYWTYQYQFLYMWKTKNPIFSIPIRLVTVLSCEKHCSLLWLARTHFRTKIYDKTFKYVYLSIYKTNTETILRVLLA